jgi:hypothetical protein
LKRSLNAAHNHLPTCELLARGVLRSGNPGNEPGQGSSGLGRPNGKMYKFGGLCDSIGRRAFLEAKLVA